MPEKLPRILLLSTFWLLGIGLGPYFSFTLLSCFAFLVFLFFFLRCRRRKEPLGKLVPTLLVALILGFCRYQQSLPRKDQSWLGGYRDGNERIFRGVVLEPPEILGERQRLVVGRLHLESSSRKLNGKVLVTTRLYPRFAYGDEVEMRGELLYPPEFSDFSYREHLAAQGIYALLKFPEIKRLAVNKGHPVIATALGLRSHAEGILNRLLPEPQVSLAAGILLGAKRSIPADFARNLQRTSTLHVVVVSGFNISVVMVFLLAAASSLRRRLRFLLAALGILGYSLIVGFSLPVLRAFLMGMSIILVRTFGREQDAFAALFFSAALITLLNPQSLWQVSFQLSFLATAGLLLFAPPLDVLFQRRVPGLIREGLVPTLAAQIAVFPIIAYNFGQISLTAPLANVFIFLLVPPIMYLAALIVLLGWVKVWLALPLAWLVWVPLTVFVKIINFFGSFSWSSLTF